MSEAMSALEHHPTEFLREVSPEAIDFYAQGLSGIFLPPAFAAEHRERYDVKRWKPEDRLEGKFGRFVVSDYTDEDEEPKEVGDLLVMGTTIGLHGLDRHGYFHSLRHYSLTDPVWDIVEARGLDTDNLGLKTKDYGDTRIVLNSAGAPVEIRVGGYSIDYGRANEEGRRTTCELFESLLSGLIKVVNVDPEPQARHTIIK